MSRVEKRIEVDKKKRKNRKILKFFFRFTFILLMICTMSVCVFVIDKHATLMFGEVDEYTPDIFLNNIGTSVMKTVEETYEKLDKLNNLKID